MQPPNLHHPLCWVVTDGKPGMENQALGLAESLTSNIIVKRTDLRWPWKQLTPYFRIGLSACFSQRGDSLTPPWPQVLIASGRQSILPALYVKQASNNKTVTIYIQNPGISPSYFDAVIAPQHDNLTGPNVIVTQGALHRVTTSRLEEDKKIFGEFAALPQPRLAVMIGGTNRAFQFDQQVAETLALQLQHLQQKYKASLLISPSRRTDAQNINRLKSTLGENQVYFWDGKGENPYFAMLAWADAIMVTCDSVSMISEACSTSKPVYLYRLPGGDPKFSRFLDDIIESGRAKWLGSSLDLTPHTPLNETNLVAHRLKNLLALNTDLFLHHKKDT